MVSYIIVILVGLTTLAVAAESVAPTTFNRHMMGMQSMMSDTSSGMGRGGRGMGMQQLADDLYENYRAAVTEALMIATGVALVSAIAVSLFVSRRVVTPIRQMMQASRYIADDTTVSGLKRAAKTSWGNWPTVSTRWPKHWNKPRPCDAI